MQKKIFNSISVCIFALLFNVAHADSKKIIGWVEPVSIDSGALELLAKIDTGADSSSLHAANVSEFEKEGLSWVSFVITNKQGDSHKITRPVVDHVLIKRRGIGPQQRPVIELEICLDNLSKTMRVNLANRESYKYQMLIGRKFLQQGFIVDPAITHLTTPRCKYQAVKSNG